LINDKAALPEMKYHTLILQNWGIYLQESLAIAKMTAQCAYIYVCPENFWESLAMLTATFPEIVNGPLL